MLESKDDKHHCLHHCFLTSQEEEYLKRLQGTCSWAHACVKVYQSIHMVSVAVPFRYQDTNQRVWMKQRMGLTASCLAAT